MGARPLNPCTSPGCRGRAPFGRCARCRALQKRTWNARRPAEERYDHRWANRRINYLTEHPRCVLCGHMATVPDHWPLSRRRLIKMGVPDPDANEYLRPLCEPCHNAETAVNQPGGWHRDRR